MRSTHLIIGILALAAIALVVQWSLRAAPDASAVMPSPSTLVATRSIALTDFDFDEPVSVRIAETSPIEVPSRVELEIEGEFEVVSSAPQPNFLRVIDAETGAHLDAVRILQHPIGNASHPGIDTTCALPPMPSPVNLDEHPSVIAAGRLHVGADGYAWQDVGIDLDAGGERLVALERGADLTVSVEPVEYREGSWLVLHAGDLAILERVLIPEDGVVEINGIRAEVVRVVLDGIHPSLLEGPISKGLEELVVPVGPKAEIEVALVAGQRTHVELTRANHAARTPEEVEIALIRDIFEDPDPTRFRNLKRRIREPERRIGIALSLFDGPSRVRFNARTAAGVEIEGNGKLRSRGTAGWWIGLAVSEPGQYTVRLPKLSGYRATDPMRVYVSDGVEDVVVQLEREFP